MRDTGPEPPVRIVIADDHPVVREGVRVLLERAGFVVHGEAGDGAAAVELAARHHPDVALLDFGMPNMNGLEAALAIATVSPGTRSVLLTGHVEAPYVLGALRAGVRGYVVKTQPVDDIAKAIRTVHRGSTYLSPSIDRQVVQACLDEKGPPRDLLTDRERQVLQLVVQSNSTKEAARALFISPKTAEAHRNRLMQKLDIHDTAGLVRYAIRAGMIEA
jgi:DNA-binding NarL/FixJ family response regulator